MKYIVILICLMLTINSYGQEIDSLKIESLSDTNEKYISINPHETVNYELDMSGIAKTDGAYIISFKQKNKLNTQKFGYYSNGQPLEKLTRIYIEKDTLTFEVIPGKYE